LALLLGFLLFLAIGARQPVLRRASLLIFARN
jgi:hypothetical protein